MQSEQNSLICIPPEDTAGIRMGGLGDKDVAGLLSGKDIGLYPLPFRFDGGDLICSQKNIFMAANCLARNQPYDDKGRLELLHILEETLGKPIMLLGDTPDDVPKHHIGMYLTPLGNRVVAVGDPNWGQEVYDPINTHNATATAPESFKPFRFVINTLEKKGFTVIRVPLVVTSQPQVYITYNNGIMETRNGKKYFYMPTYDIPELDNIAAAVFEQQGITVKRVRVNNIYHQTGSLRCLVGIMRRK